MKLLLPSPWPVSKRTRQGLSTLGKQKTFLCFTSLWYVVLTTTRLLKLTKSSPLPIFLSLLLKNWRDVSRPSKSVGSRWPGEITLQYYRQDGRLPSHIAISKTGPVHAYWEQVVCDWRALGALGYGLYDRGSIPGCLFNVFAATRYVCRLSHPKSKGTSCHDEKGSSLEILKLLTYLKQNWPRCFVCAPKVKSCSQLQCGTLCGCEWR